MKTNTRLFTRHGLAIFLVASLMAAMVACSSTPVAPTPPTETPTTVAAKLVFSTQPVGGAAGSAFTTQPVVMVQDAKGNTVTSYRAVLVLTLTTGTGNSEARLYGGTTVKPVNGVFQFAGLSLDKAGSGYRLTATSASLPPATSDPFGITPGAAVQLVFTRQPVESTAGSAFATQPVVEIQDIAGNVATGYVGPVALSLLYGRAVLFGTATVNAVNGVATFTGLSIRQAANAYVLLATAQGLSTGSSNMFNITAAAPVKLAFTTQPAEATAGSAFATQPVVAVQDIYGNAVANAPTSVSLAITPKTAAGGAILSGVTTATPDRWGEANFTDLSIDKVGSGYTLTATSSGLTSATSDPFDVTPPPTPGKP